MKYKIIWASIKILSVVFASLSLYEFSTQQYSSAFGAAGMSLYSVVVYLGREQFLQKIHSWSDLCDSQVHLDLYLHVLMIIATVMILIGVFGDL